MDCENDDLALNEVVADVVGGLDACLDQPSGESDIGAVHHNSAHEDNRGVADDETSETFVGEKPHGADTEETLVDKPDVISRNFICKICLCSVVTTRLPCGHLFCEDCIRELIREKNKKCGNCSRKFKRKILRTGKCYFC